MEIPLHDRTGRCVAVTVVDDEDFDRVCGLRWFMSCGYAVAHITRDGRRTTIRLARLVLGLDFRDNRRAEHIDRNRLNNARNNLRVVEGEKENQQNRNPVSTGSSLYRGVVWNKQKRKWQAGHKWNGRFHFIGLFDDEDEAGRSAAQWRRHHMPYSPEALDDSIGDFVRPIVRTGPGSRPHQRPRNGRGVSRHKRTGKWAAYVGSGKSRRHLGYYETENEATAAVAEARQ